MNTITMSAIMVTLFFGGPDGPGFHFLRWLWPILWFAGKTVVFLYVHVWIRAALPRLRYDQLMDLGWKVLIPLSLGWLLVVAAFRVGHRSGASAVFRGCVVAGGGLWQAMQVARARREELPSEGSAPMSDRPPADAHLRAVPEPDGGAVMAKKATQEEVARVLRRLRRHLEAGRRAAGDDAVPDETSCRSRRASTAATSSTATRTGWRSASAASCARRCARRTASTCAGSTTRPTTPVSPGERYGFVYEINYLRCIHCDLCVEACPTEAITESKMFEFSFTNRSDAIYTKTRARRRRRRPAPAPPLGGLARGRGRAHLGLDAGDLAVGRGRVRGRGAVVGRARLRRPRRPKAARAADVTTRRPATSRSARSSGTRSRAASGARCAARDATCSPPPRSPTRSPSPSRR